MLINMKLLLTSELVERLNAVPDLDITQMVLPESVMKIKRLVKLSYRQGRVIRL